MHTYYHSENEQLKRLIALQQYDRFLAKISGNIVLGVSSST